MNKISTKAKIGVNVTIGDFSVVHDNVIIGDNSVVEGHCSLGVSSSSGNSSPLVIGPNAHIRSHSVFYDGSTFGEGLTTGHAVIVRGGTQAGDGLQIGSQTDIEGECVIGDYVRTHSHVHISQDAKIGNFVWFFPRVTFTNDPLPPSHIRDGVTVEDMAIICTGAILLPGIRIGKGAFVAAGSLVRSSVPDVTCVAGNPAAPFNTLNKLVNFNHGISYPWPKHFRQGYPDSAVEKMLKLAEEVQQLMDDFKGGQR